MYEGEEKKDKRDNKKGRKNTGNHFSIIQEKEKYTLWQKKKKN